MKKRNTTKAKASRRSRKPAVGKTEIEGQNSRANDAPDYDVHHDESRRNLYDPEVAENLMGSDKKKNRKSR